MLSVILAAAAVAGAPVPPARTSAAQAPDTKVCHIEPIQGSRITHKVCLTPAQAAQLAREARDLLDRAQAGYQPPNMANMVSMGPAR